MSFSIKLGHFLYNHAFWLYKPMYAMFKKRQDRFEISLLKQHLREGDVVLDIGANIGFYARLISEMVGPKGQVHCFEPDQNNFKHLVRYCASLKNASLNQKAVGSKTEKLNIYTSRELNVDHRTYEPEEYDDIIEIEAISIDDYLSGKQHRVDLIKMDIQGFEIQALKGMQRTLEENPNIKIISEFWPYGLRSAGSSALLYFNRLKQLGFTVYLLKHGSLVKLREQKVIELNEQGKETYYNIFALREHV